MALLQALQELLRPQIERLSAEQNNAVVPVQAPTMLGRMPSEMQRNPYEMMRDNPGTPAMPLPDMNWTEMQPGGGRFKLPEDSSVWDSGTGSFVPAPVQETPWYKDDEKKARLALALNSMRLEPDQGLAAVLADRVKTIGAEKKAEKSKNKTIVALQNMGMGEGELDLLAENPELLKVAAQAMYKARTGQDATAEIRTLEKKLEGLPPDIRKKAILIDLGIEPRAGQPLETYFGRGYAGAAGTAAGTTEAEYVKQATTNRILKSQLDFGFDNLGSALGATGQTGKIFGNLPAITTGAQIADNAKAVLLPVMKGVWRGAGEGVFTDKDQETLEAMFPSRDMTPEAAKQALLVVRQLTELKLQNPTFDINMYGNALRNRGAPAAPAAPAMATPMPQTGAPKPSLRDEADAIIGR